MSSQAFLRGGVTGPSLLDSIIRYLSVLVLLQTCQASSLHSAKQADSPLDVDRNFVPQDDMKEISQKFLGFRDADTREDDGDALHLREREAAMKNRFQKANSLVNGITVHEGEYAKPTHASMEWVFQHELAKHMDGKIAATERQQKAEEQQTKPVVEPEGSQSEETGPEQPEDQKAEEPPEQAAEELEKPLARPAILAKASPKDDPKWQEYKRMRAAWKQHKGSQEWKARIASESRHDISGEVEEKIAKHRSGDDDASGTDDRYTHSLQTVKATMEKLRQGRSEPAANKAVAGEVAKKAAVSSNAASSHEAVPAASSKDIPLKQKSLEKDAQDIQALADPEAQKKAAVPIKDDPVAEAIKEAQELTSAEKDAVQREVVGEVSQEKAAKVAKMKATEKEASEQLKAEVETQDRLADKAKREEAMKNDWWSRMPVADKVLAASKALTAAERAEVESSTGEFDDAAANKAKREVEIKRQKEEMLKEKIALEVKKAEAIKTENFEVAALLRDRLARLESKLAKLEMSGEEVVAQRNATEEAASVAKQKAAELVKRAAERAADIAKGKEFRKAKVAALRRLWNKAKASREAERAYALKAQKQMDAKIKAESKKPQDEEPQENVNSVEGESPVRLTARHSGCPDELTGVTTSNAQQVFDHRASSDWKRAQAKKNKYPTLVTKNYFIAACLHDSAEIFSRWSTELTKFILAIMNAEGSNVFVSVYESGSTDGTRALLKELGSALSAMGVSNKIMLGSVTREPNENRIDFLAKIRNIAMNPMYEVEKEMHFDRVMWFNDNIFCAAGPLQQMLLTGDLSEGGSDADAACAMDFDMTDDYQITCGFYDIWVDKDMNGSNFKKPYPYSGFGPTAERVARGKPFQVFSCWGGMVAFKADLFTKEKLKFRRNRRDQGECPSSESELIFHDMWRIGRNKIVVAPNSRTAYTDYDFLMCVKGFQQNIMTYEEVQYQEKPPQAVNCCPLGENETFVEFSKCHKEDWEKPYHDADVPRRGGFGGGKFLQNRTRQCDFPEGTRAVLLPLNE